MVLWADLLVNSDDDSKTTYMSVSLLKHKAITNCNTKALSPCSKNAPKSLGLEVKLLNQISDNKHIVGCQQYVPAIVDTAYKNKQTFNLLWTITKHTATYQFFRDDTQFFEMLYYS